MQALSSMIVYKGITHRSTLVFLNGWLTNDSTVNYGTRNKCKKTDEHGAQTDGERFIHRVDTAEADDNVADAPRWTQ